MWCRCHARVRRTEQFRREAVELVRKSGLMGAPLTAGETPSTYHAQSLLAADSRQGLSETVAGSSLGHRPLELRKEPEGIAHSFLSLPNSRSTAARLRYSLRNAWSRGGSADADAML